MRFFTALAILSLVSAAYGYSDNRVYNIVADVEAGNYDGAIETANQLNNEHRKDLVREAIEDLFQNSKRNLIDFGYHLERAYPGRELFNEIFPVEIRRIIVGDNVRLINKRDYMPLKLGFRADSDGDRKAYGDDSDALLKTIAWKFTPVFDNNQLYFHIFSLGQNQYLKLANSADRVGDRTAYGGNNPTDSRYQWYLVPMRVGNNNLFYIVNKEYNQALKLSRAVDADGDRTAYGHNGNYRSYPDSFAWYLTRY